MRTKINIPLALTLVVTIGFGLNSIAQSSTVGIIATSDLNGFLLKSGYTVLKMTKLTSGHLHFSGVLNGAEGSFILDTGASGTVIDVKNKERFNMRSQDSERRAAGAGGSRMQMQVSEENNLQIGTLEIKNLRLMLMNLDHVNQAFEGLGLKPVNGVIGADILTTYEAIIDYVNLTLYLKN